LNVQFILKSQHVEHDAVGVLETSSGSVKLDEVIAKTKGIHFLSGRNVYWTHKIFDYASLRLAIPALA